MFSYDGCADVLKQVSCMRALTFPDPTSTGLQCEQPGCTARMILHSLPMTRHPDTYLAMGLAFQLMQWLLVQVNWSVLWRTWMERDTRELIVLPLIVLIILVPIGLFTGTSPSASSIKRSQILAFSGAHLCVGREKVAWLLLRYAAPICV